MRRAALIVHRREAPGALQSSAEVNYSSSLVQGVAALPA